MTLPELAVSIAETQLGVREEPIGSNRGKMVNEYLLSVGLPGGNFWCMAFVYWCYQQAAKQLLVANPLPKTAGCLDHWHKTKGRKIAKREAVLHPELVTPGAVFIMDHGKGAGHTGIVVSVDGQTLTTIEGNTNEAGSRNGIGVFRRKRTIAAINKGFVVYEGL